MEESSKVLPHQLTLLFLSVVGFFVALGFSLIVPVLPIFARNFGATNFEIGAIVSGFAIARLLFNLPAGVLSDRLGNKSLIILGLIIVALASILIGFAANYQTILVGRIISGFGSAFYITTSTTLLAKITGTRKRGRSLSIYDTVQRIGFILGPFVGGLLFAKQGPNIPFFSYAIFLFIAAAVAYVGIKSSDERHLHQEKLRFRDVQDLYKNRSFIAVSLATFAIFFVLVGLNNTILPLFAFENLGLDIVTYGLIYTTYIGFYTITLVPTGFLSDRFGRKPFMLTSMLAGGIVIFLLPTSSNAMDFTIIMIVFGVASGLTGNIAAWISDLVPQERTGMAIGFYRVISDLGLVIGPLLLTGLGSSTARVENISFYSAGMVLIVFGLLLLLARDPARKKTRA